MALETKPLQTPATKEQDNAKTSLHSPVLKGSFTRAGARFATLSQYLVSILKLF